MQTFSDFECVIVDDNSKDGTYIKAQESILGDERFNLIKIPHGGPQRAKMAGLSYSCGEYVLFVDGDDTLHPDCLRECNENAKECDLLIFGINYQEFLDNVLVKEYTSRLIDVEFATGSEFADCYIYDRNLSIYSSTNRIYKNDVLKKWNIKFRNDLFFGEDRLFNFDFLKVSKKIKFIPKALYNYRRINKNSITSTFRRHHINELVYLHKKKMECILGITSVSSDIDIESFKRYDISKAVCEAFRHISEHITELSDFEKESEISYLSTYDLPNYFYGGNESYNNNLIDYINKQIFPENNEINIDNVTTVIVLGCTRCKYGVEGAFNKFGTEKKYICCGGNISCYKDTEGHLMTEAEYMAYYLKANGVIDIFVEKQSRYTAENIKYAISELKPEECPVVVTGAYHKKRTEKILKGMNLKWDVFPTYGPKPDSWFKNKNDIISVISEFERLV